MLQDKRQSARISAAEALGKMGESASEQAPKIAELLKDEDSGVRRTAARALGKMGESASEQASKIVELLKDEDWGVRYSAVIALGKMGESASEQAPKIAELLKDKPSNVRKIGSQDIKTTLNVLSPIYDDSSRKAKLRFIAHYVCSGAEKNEVLIKYLGESGVPIPSNMTKDIAIDTLNVFLEAWAVTDNETHAKLRKDLAGHIADVVKESKLRKGDLESNNIQPDYLINNFKEDFPHEATTIKTALIEPGLFQKVFKIGEKTLVIVIPTHILFWIVLVFYYPKSPTVQAIFFWNKWVRTILGFGYVSLLLTNVPFLRKRLFAPFKESLIADANLKNFDTKAYFSESEVKEKSSSKFEPVNKAIPEIKGQIVLEGESGLGKSMFLQNLVKNTDSIVVYLPAEKCKNGVVDAIKSKLHGEVGDPDFLSYLIYIGAIDICIDGLNEVTADTRAKVAEFMQNNSKSNIIVATQPLEWTSPDMAEIYIIQPLRRDQIEDFLITCKQSLPENARVEGENYEKACSEYLSEALDENQPQEIFESAIRILSNPMDLTVVADMLAMGENPDIFHLQEQQYTTMAKEYKKVYHQSDFPLMRFSDTVYEMRLKDDDEKDVPEEEFLNELEMMEKYKMVLKRQTEVRKWYFRHDKIMEYFIVQTFLGADNDRPQKHLGDPRFRGVYFLLAILMPIEEAERLRELLINYAADTKDHTVSDEFVQIFRSRSGIAA